MKKQKSKKAIIIAVIGLLVFFLGITNKFFSQKFIGTVKPVHLSGYSFIGRLKSSLSILLNKDNFICNTENIKEAQEIIQNEENKVLLEENTQLKETLNFLSANGYLQNDDKNFITTYIIGRDSIDSSIFIIDRGSGDGIKTGMPVIINNGILVGKIIRVMNNFSHFIPITDNRSELSASINNEDKINGLVRGSYNLAIKMELIPIDKDIKEGDIVVTSGMDKFIPSGLVIGRVLRVNKKDNDIFGSAELSTLSSFDNINIVTVLK